jgi:serine phosphatase RsbU (regulator of sigma subunit)/HAMP domain-containing protein
MRRRIGIRGKIAAVILLCTIPVLLLAVALYTRHIADRRSIVVRTQEDLARALARDVATFFANAVHTERLAGAAVTGQPYSVGGITQLFAALRTTDPAFQRLVLATLDGTVQAGDPAPPASQLSSAVFEQIRGGAAWAAGAPYLDNGRPIVEVAAAIMDHGKPVAVIDGMLDLGRLPSAVPTAGTSEADAVVVAGTGSIMLDLRTGVRPAATLRALPAVDAALRGRTGDINAYDNPWTHRRDIGAAVPISALGWAAVVLVPDSTAYEPVRREAEIEAGWLLGYLAVGLVLAWILGGELSAPIQQLVDAARRVGRGQVGYHVPVRRTDELGELAAAFNDMSAQLEQYVSEMSAVQAVSDAALSTVRLDELLPPLVQRVVAALGGDGGAVWFLDEETGELVAPEPFGRHPGAARRLRPGEGLAGRTAQAYRAVPLRDLEELRAVDPELAARGVQAALSVPLRVGGRTIGVVEVLARAPRNFGARDIRLLETFADRVALAVSNARSYERQQEIGRVIQQALMPSPSLRLPGVAMAGRYQPSREVGGDFYAALPLADGRIGLAIADVAGKGIPAATLAARTRYLLEALALDGRDPAEVLARLNTALVNDPGTNLFVSLFYAVLTPARGLLRWASAGHLPPLLFRADAARPAPLDAAGLLLGIQPGETYTSRETVLAPGDVLVLYTDGLTEARRADGELFGDARFAAAVADARGGSPEEIADAVMHAVADWAGVGQRDDRALAVIRFAAVAAAAREPRPGRTVTIAL